jgi:APA family basic amino acid/polyamine antiporter
VAFIIITLFLLSSVQKILDYVMFFDSIGMSLAVGSVFVLRHRAKKNGEPAGIYKMFAYPLLPVLFILVYMGVNVSVMINNPDTAMIGFIMLMSGWPLYYIIRFILKGKGMEQSNK